MAWDKPDNSTIVFECDTCPQTVTCTVDVVRRTAPEIAIVSDFGACWRYAQGLGWRSFKRAGKDWTYHCLSCGSAAEVAHRDHKRQELERDRLKDHNARG